MGDAARILSEIKSPLALAALSLLIVAQALRGIAKKDSTREGRWVPQVDRLLLLAATLGVLAIVSYTLEASFHREHRVSGTVRDESGVALPGARVDIAGAAGGNTGPDGSFEFMIPDSRLAAKFVVDVTKDGFQPARIDATVDSIQGLRVVLHRPPWRDEDALSFGPQMAIRHFLGVPQMDITIVAQNPTPDPLDVSDLLVRVESGGRSKDLVIEATYLPTGGISAPLTRLSLRGRQSFPVTHALTAVAPDVLVFLNTMVREANRAVPATALPDPRATYLKASIADSASRVMRSHFFWAAGESHLHVEATFGTRRVKRDLKFFLTEQQVDTMRAIASMYSSGIGVFPNWRTFPAPSAAPVVVSLSP